MTVPVFSWLSLELPEYMKFVENHIYKGWRLHRKTGKSNHKSKHARQNKLDTTIFLMFHLFPTNN